MPEDILPEQLRGKSPQEQKFILGQMAQTLTTLNREVQELRQQRAPGVARGMRVDDDEDERPRKPAKPSKPLEELILEDPESAISQVVEKLYGPGIAQMQQGVEEVVESVSAREFDDWDEMKDEVYQVLREANAPKTKANLNQAYQLVVGRRTLEAKRINRAAALNPDIPTDTAPKQAARELHGLEREIFEASGMSREEWDQYGDASNLQIRVPGEKKEASNA